MITREQVIALADSIAGYPHILNKIISMVDDEHTNISELVLHIKCDPVLSARVLSVANIAARKRELPEIRDIHNAVKLIGMSRVRELALTISEANINDFGFDLKFWQHSVAVAICSDELSRFAGGSALDAEIAYCAGLLHDIGQLWLYCHYSDEMHKVWEHVISDSVPIEVVEREHFGVDHSVIGMWLAEHLQLPKSFVSAIQGHHTPDTAVKEPLLPILHIAEVLANALDLNLSKCNHVTSVSARALNTLGMSWGAKNRPDYAPLFGRIDARSRHAKALFE
jgi:putative nucleotidyltransferase with HDIG domain